MTRASPTVLISILHWNDDEATAACLETVMADDYANKVIIVTDNASTTPIPEALKQRFPSVNFVRNEVNLGFTGGHNQVLRNPDYHYADYFWILNNDTKVVPGCLAALVEAALAHPCAGLLSPQLCSLEDVNKIEFFAGKIDNERFGFPRLAAADAYKAAQITPNQIWLVGTALLLNKRLADSGELWLDDRLFAYYDDNDVCMRSIRAGFINLAVPNARVQHHTPVIATRGAHFHYLMTRNNWLFWKTHFPSGLFSRYFIEYIARTLSHAGKLLPDYPDKARVILLGAWHALTGQYGPPKMQPLPPMWLTRIILLAPFKTATLLRLFAPRATHEK